MAATDPYAVPTKAFAQAMAGGEREARKPTPAAAFTRARELFQAGTRIDMLALAADLGVARATLYRWTGDRERLLSDVLWAEVEGALTAIDAAMPGHGLIHINNVTDRLLRELSGNPALLTFLAAEDGVAFRLLTAPDGGVRPRLVAMIAAMIAREAADSEYVPPADPALLADAIVSLGERFLYHGGLPDMNPDPATARSAIGLLLRP
jgi:AcrR family transcriptional regulator